MPYGDRDVKATFCFVDLAGFTALTEAHGDQAAADLIARFGALVEGAVEGGTAIVDMIGDAAFLASEAPEDAIGSVARIFELAQLESDFPALRAGLHHGDAVLHGDRWIGTAVNVAARVAGQARGGQILATAVVAARAAARGMATSSLGAVALRNLVEPVELFSVELDALSRSSTVIDPVCRMSVVPGAASGHLRFDDRDFWFCSLECVTRFASTPNVYAAAAR